ncbi:AMP-binding enzyme, partial [Gordonia sp. UBA7860]|uniref:AMP-binding enzyme n=1 Tax=Gordonia sp. UBA7860 TaxID=1946579 RepID=UPI0025809045
PAGVVGELYLAGPALARGYAGRPALTAERFVAAPFELRDCPGAGARMYRTGDLVRWTSAGLLEYIGRSDFQVKIRGLRIELGEIESALRAVEGIGGAVAVGVDTPTGTRLAAYVAPTQGATPDPVAARSEVSGRLASSMVPDAIVAVAAIPLTPIGKIDRNA